MSEKEIILNVITHPAGYDVDLFGMFCVRPVEGGSFCVTYDDLDEKWEKCFDKAEDAVDFFIEKRNELKLGIDIESALFRRLICSDTPQCHSISSE